MAFRWQLINYLTGGQAVQDDETSSVASEWSILHPEEYEVDQYFSDPGEDSSTPNTSRSSSPSGPRRRQDSLPNRMDSGSVNQLAADCLDDEDQTSAKPTRRARRVPPNQTVVSNANNPRIMSAAAKRDLLFSPTNADKHHKHPQRVYRYKSPRQRHMQHCLKTSHGFQRRQIRMLPGGRPPLTAASVGNRSPKV